MATKPLVNPPPVRSPIADIREGITAPEVLATPPWVRYFAVENDRLDWAIDHSGGGGGGGGDFQLEVVGDPGTQAPGSVTRTVAQKLSERVSVFDFGAVGDGATNDGPAIQKAINYIASKGGGEVFFPGGFTYKVNAALTVGAAQHDVTLVGENLSAVVKRGGTIPGGLGLIDVSGTAFGIRTLTIDGAVTSPARLTYAAFGSDPMNPLLTGNTSIWVHGGAGDFSMVESQITHTGGYAVLLDSDAAQIESPYIADNIFTNNRPHLFGVTVGEENYGAWTGGIFLRGDCRTTTGKLFVVKNAVIEGNEFTRCNGNCIWMHSYGFDVHHENFSVNGNSFFAIARDGILFGNLSGAACTANVMSHVGFTTLTDSDMPVGAYLESHYAVGIDHSGYVQNATISGNSIHEFYGGGIDCDGLRDFVIDGNSLYSSQPIAKGIQLGDTSGNLGGDSGVISANRIGGCNAGAIILNQSQYVVCSGNTIQHPTGAAVAPILLYSLDKQTKNNVVKDNICTWADNGFFIAEDDGFSGNGFDASCVNTVIGNTYYGGIVGEFFADSNSGSLTGLRLSSNEKILATRQEAVIQREGSGASAALKIYLTENLVRKQFFQLQFANGLLNISEDGAVQTGIYTTGNRSTLGFKDAMWSGKLMSDGFVAAYDYAGAGSSFQAADANALTDNWALLRFNKVGGVWEQSVAVSGGARIWGPLSGGGGSISGLTAGRVVFAAGPTTLADSGNFLWDNTARRLTVAGIAASPGIQVTTGFIDSGGGFFTGNVNTDAIQALSGGVTVKYLIGTSSMTLATDAAAALSAAGQGRLRFNGTKFQASENGGAYVDLIGSGGGLSGLVSPRIPYATSATSIGNSGLTWDNANLRLGVNKTAPGTALHVGGQGYFDGAASGAGLTCADGYVESFEGFFSNFTSYQTFQSPSGGMYARSHRSAIYTQVGNNNGIPVVTSGDVFQAGAMYWDTGAAQAKIFNGSTWLTIATGGAAGVTGILGTANQVLANGTSGSAQTGAVTLSLPQDIHSAANVSFGTVTTTNAVVSNRATNPAISAPNGSVQAKGFASVGLSAKNAMQSDSGISCGTDANGGFYVGFTPVIDTGSVWVGKGINQPDFGAAASGFNPKNAGIQYFGQNLGAVSIRKGDNSGAITMTVYGGVIVGFV